MLNQNFRPSFLHEALKEYLDTIDLIQEEILGPQKHSLINDRKRLGHIHHALNISEYKKSDFRFELLSRAPDELLIQFLNEVGLLHGEKIDESKRFELISKASKLSWKDNKETRAFVKIFGYEESLIPLQTESPPQVETVQVYGAPLKTLFEYQSKIFYQSVDLVENEWMRFIIQMPTGAGKTRTAMELVAHFLNTGIASGKERRVMWLSDKMELSEQAIESFTHTWPHLGKKAAKVYRLWGGSTIDTFESNSFIVAGYDKLNFLLKNKNKLPFPDLIVCDEAHNSISPTYKETIETLADNGARVVGLTATPIRAINSIENQELREFFNDRIIDIDVDENAIQYLQKKGYLSHCIDEVIDSNTNFGIPKDIMRLASKERDLGTRFLEKIANNNERNLAIARLLKKLGDEGIKVLYFAPRIKQSKLMCALLISFGFSAAHIDGTTPKEYRRDVIKKFSDGIIRIVCNCDVFTTGFDDPKIDAIVIGRPTKSIVLHQQMIGRGMRGPKMGGTPIFRLYRINDNLPEIALADQYFVEEWGKS